MKKVTLGIGILVSVLVFCLNLTGCSNLLNNDALDNSLAKVSIPLPKNQKRNIADAIENSNFFEAIFYRYKQDGTKYLSSYNASASSADNSIELTIPIGTYDVLVLAGNKNSSVEYLILLASGFAENQNIIKGNNTIPITLLSVDYSLTIPSTVEVGSEFVVSLNFTLRNEFLWNRLWLISTSLYTESSGTNIVDNSLMGAPFYSGSETSDTNVAPMTEAVESINGASYIHSSSSISSEQYVGSNNTWYFFNSSHPTFGNRISSQTITFIASDSIPRVAVEIIWGNE
jgi:hypothetical protein